MNTHAQLQNQQLTPIRFPKENTPNPNQNEKPMKVETIGQTTSKRNPTNRTPIKINPENPSSALNPGGYSNISQEKFPHSQQPTNQQQNNIKSSKQ
jgi:hypothetical protein